MAFLKRNILIVDANNAGRLAIESILRQAGYTCSVADDSFDAIEMAHKYPFDLIITEVVLAHGSGADMLKRLRSNQTTKNVPVVFISDRTEKAFIQRCIQLGANDYLIKPVDSKILLQKVERILGGRPRFAEVPISEDETGYSEVVFQSHVVSIGETGMVIWSPIPLDQDATHRIRAKVFAQIGIHSPDLKVVHCEPQEQGYNVYFSFVGMKDLDMKNVRSWVVEKKLKDIASA